ncbi:hypothetical protein GSI_08497 [Ganoderma sinense ZZ0214-1]|uniref:Glycosyl hydrolase family 92 domain-containing protein n=1 Tax=Ganoderma sinense ZZ0214-1 TaxID=1077348 RepID=A0A2G8S3V8_9APHY|nr:hypothetical protein GSI_08497 [Ganoderma sinense ZZ0214-1]
MPFISIKRAWANLNNEIPDGVMLEEMADKTCKEWAELYPCERDEDGKCCYSDYDNRHRRYRKAFPEPVAKGFKDFNLDTTWDAVHKDATVPPNNNWTGPRPTTTEKRMATSRMLGYVYDDGDYSTQWMSALTATLNETSVAMFFRPRAFSTPFTVFDNAPAFMEACTIGIARADGDQCWAEGVMWAHTFNVVHDASTLLVRRGRETQGIGGAFG